MLNAAQRSALDEVSALRKECQQLLDNALAACALDSTGSHTEASRMVLTPFLYSVWERCFTTCIGIMAGYVRGETESAKKLSHKLAALWLQKEGFHKSYLDKISRMAKKTERKEITGSAYAALSEFLSEYRTWESNPINPAIDPAELVMTFSNVNCAVLDVNAEAFALESVPEYAKARRGMGRLEDLVGRRNDIGHGTLLNVPGPREFADLVEFTRTAVIDPFCESVQYWILYGPVESNAST